MYIPIKFSRAKSDKVLPSKTYALDFEGKRIRGYISGRKAVEQAIMKALLTQRFIFPVYDSDYGNDLRKILCADGVTSAFLDTELPRLVEDALLVDARITGVEDFSYEISGDSISISMTVKTIFGDETMEVTV